VKTQEKGPLKVVWVDDDSPALVRPREGFKVYTSKSCRAAIDLIESGVDILDWVVVDLILPQGNWGATYVVFPGLALLKYLREKYQSRIGLMAFSVVMTDPIREMALEAGAQEALAKTAHSWQQVLSSIEGLSRTGDGESECGR
jgi:CheY-like chemotaxis protein